MVSTTLKSWISYTANTQFPLENIPFGIFQNPRTNKAVGCTRIGDYIIDLCELEHERLFDGPLFSVTKDHFFCESTLNRFASMGKAYRVELR
jgi:fumarylacetoacetase